VKSTEEILKLAYDIALKEAASLGVRRTVSIEIQGENRPYF
jgi:hypothetical protein